MIFKKKKKITYTVSIFKIKIERKLFAIVLFFVVDGLVKTFEEFGSASNFQNILKFSHWKHDCNGISTDSTYNTGLFNISADLICTNLRAN